MNDKIKVLKTFSENLKYQREKKGITLKQLCRLCGLSRSSMKGYERGEQNPTLLSLVKIADVLDCKISDLIEESNKQSSFLENLKEAFKNFRVDIDFNNGCIQIVLKDDDPAIKPEILDFARDYYILKSLRPIYGSDIALRFEYEKLEKKCENLF